MTTRARPSRVVPRSTDRVPARHRKYLEIRNQSNRAAARAASADFEHMGESALEYEEAPAARVRIGVGRCRGRRTSRRRFAASVAARMLPAGALARSIERADTGTRRAASDARGVDANGDGDGDDARGAVARGGATARANGATTPRAMDTEVRRARDPKGIICGARFFASRGTRRRARRDSARDFAPLRDGRSAAPTLPDVSMRLGRASRARRWRRAAMEARRWRKVSSRCALVRGPRGARDERRRLDRARLWMGYAGGRLKRRHDRHFRVWRRGDGDEETREGAREGDGID